MRHYMLGSCACGVALLALSATISVTTAAECTTGDTGVGDEWPEEVKMPKLLYLWLPGYDSYGLTIFNDVRTYMQSRDSGWTADRFAVADTPADLSSYTQIWLYDLSYSASDSNYAAQYKRIADWWRMDNRREVVCDGRILSSVHKGRTQICELCTACYRNLFSFWLSRCQFLRKHATERRWRLDRYAHTGSMLSTSATLMVLIRPMATHNGRALDYRQSGSHAGACA